MRTILLYLWKFTRIVLIVLFFPMSLLFVAYARQMKAKREYFAQNEDGE